MIALSAIPTEEDRNKFREIYEENYLKMYHVALGMIKNQAEFWNLHIRIKRVQKLQKKSILFQRSHRITYRIILQDLMTCQ